MSSSSLGSARSKASAAMCISVDLEISASSLTCHAHTDTRGRRSRDDAYTLHVCCMQRRMAMKETLILMGRGRLQRAAYRLGDSKRARSLRASGGGSTS